MLTFLLTSICWAWETTFKKVSVDVVRMLTIEIVRGQGNQRFGLLESAPSAVQLPEQYIVREDYTLGEDGFVICPIGQKLFAASISCVTFCCVIWGNATSPFWSIFCLLVTVGKAEQIAPESSSTPLCEGRI